MANALSEKLKTGISLTVFPFDFTEDAAENPTFYAELDNPQSLNKYQYTYNNPLNMTDDGGHCPPCVPIPSMPVDTELITNPSRALDKLLLKISAVGLAPGAGEIADVVNAAISTARGNLGEAALDLAGAAGPVGSAAAMGNRVRNTFLARYHKCASTRRPDLSFGRQHWKTVY